MLYGSTPSECGSFLVAVPRVFARRLAPTPRHGLSSLSGCRKKQYCLVHTRKEIRVSVLLGNCRGVFSGFDGFDFSDAAGVAAAFEGGFDPGINDLFHETLADEVSREAQDVGVVVTAGELCGEFIVTDRCTNAFDLVGGDRHANTCAAHEDAQIGLIAGDEVADFVGTLGIVARARGAIAHEGCIMAFAPKFFVNLADGGYASVVG